MHDQTVLTGQVLFQSSAGQKVMNQTLVQDLDCVWHSRSSCCAHVAAASNTWV